MTSKRSRSAAARRRTKDRVLQARIPAQLDEELRSRAGQMGLSVSTIVRNVLLNTFDLVEGVVSDSAELARAIQGQAATRPTSVRSDTDGEPAEIFGWQELVMNCNGVCDECNAALSRGDKAALGIPTGARPVFLCADCLGSLPRPIKQDRAPAPGSKPRRSRRQRRD